MNKLAIAVVLGLNAGCASINQSVTPNYDAKFGEAVREAKYQMTINPDAGKIPDQVVGIDGMAAKKTIVRYQNSFEKPPPTVPVINIGGSMGRGGGGD
jgi:hypothetical protein